MLWDLALFGFLTDRQSDQTVPLPLSYKALNSALLRCETAASICCSQGQESFTSTGNPQTLFFSAPQASSPLPSWWPQNGPGQRGVSFPLQPALWWEHSWQ